MIDLTKPFWIIFMVMVAVCLPILWYYARSNPNPRFRPRVGELALVAVLMTFGSCGIAFLLSFVFKVEDMKGGYEPPGQKSPRQPSTSDDGDE